jgi:lysophospholipase L1-like esterase
MATIVKRIPLGRKLSYLEMDANWANLNNELMAATAFNTASLTGIGKKRVGKSIMWLGDSITSKTSAMGIFARGEPYYKLFPTYTNLNTLGVFIAATRPIGTCPAGAGSLTYTSSSTSLTWQAFGDSPGAPVPIPTSGFYTLESGSPDHQLVVAIVQRLKPAGNATDTVTISGGPLVLSNQATVGFSGWLETQLRNPFSQSLNYGIAGIRASDWLAASAQWSGIYTDLTNIHLGTNDVSSRATALQCLLDIEAIIQLRQALGSVCVLWTLLPYNARATAANQAVAEFNQGIRILGDTYHCDVADAWQFVANPDTSVTWASGLSGDGLHPGSKGAYIMAKRAGVPIYSKYVQPRHTMIPTAMAYSATDAPYGNLANNGNLTGTSGTLGTGVSGTLPTSWIASRTTGSVMTAVATAPDAGSPIARTDGRLGNWCRLVCTNTGGVDGETIQFRGASFMTAGNFSAGDLVVLEGEIQLSGSGIQYVAAWGGSAGTGRYTYGLYGEVTTSGEIGDLDGDTVYIPFRSQPLRIASGDTNFNIYFEIRLLANGVANLDIGQSINFHKVAP